MAVNIAGSTVSKFVKAQKELDIEIDELGVFGNSEGLFAIKELEDSVFARNNIGPKTREYIKSLRKASIAEMTFSEKLKLSTIALKEQAAAFLASPLGGAAVLAAAVYVAVKLVDRFTESVDESREKLVALSDALTSIDTEISDAESNLKRIADRIDEINSKDSIHVTELEELALLREQSRELERIINLKKIERDLKQSEVNGRFVTTVHKNLHDRQEYIKNDRLVSDNYTPASGVVKTMDESDYINAVLMRRDEILSSLTQPISSKEKQKLEGLLSDIDSYLAEKISEYTGDMSGVSFIKGATDEHQKAVNAAIIEYEDTIDKIAIAMDTAGSRTDAFYRLINTEFADSTDALQAIGEQGRLTEEAFKDALRSGGYDEFIVKLQELGVVSRLLTNDDIAFLVAGFNSLGEAVGGAGQKIADAVLSFRDSLEAIQKLSGGFDQLKTIWQDIQNGGTFTFSNLIGNEALNSAFGNLGDVFDDFIRTVSNAPADLNACQNAFNELASAYIHNSGVLNSLTEENRNAAVAMLESMGVANAAAVVDETLAVQKERLRYATGDFAEMEYKEVYALYEASEAGSTARTELAQLALEKFRVNQTGIKTSGDIQNLINLAKAANATASYIANLEYALRLFENRSSTYNAQDIRDRHDARRYQELLNSVPEYDDIEFDFSVPDIEFDFSVPDIDYGGSGGGSSEREETWFEKQYKLHKHMIAMEQESVADFLLWLDDAYKKAYAEGILTLDDYRQHEEEVFDGLKEIQDNAKAAIESLVDYKQDMLKQELEDEKDSLDKRLDNLKDFYDKQKDLLEKQRDLEKTENERSGLRRDVQDIEADLQTLARDDSAWAAKRRLELEEELSEAKKSLDEFEKEQAFDLAMDALDSAYSAQEQQIQAEMDALDKKLNDPHALYNQALAAIQGNTLGLYTEMVAYNRKHGSGKEDDVSGIYEEAYKSLLLYQKIQGKPYEGITLPNATGYVGYASGTASASPGIHSVHENGFEYIFESADGSKYRVFQGGEMVLNAQDTKFLYNFASNGGAAFRQLYEYIAKYAGTTGVGGIPNTVQVTMGDVIIQGNADSRTVSQIRREQRSSIDYMLKELARLGK